MRLENRDNPENKEERLLAILDDLGNDKSSISKVEVINIAKNLIQEKSELINEKEEWGSGLKSPLPR